MVDQKEEAKKEKFIETMPTMIQTHLIICKDWAEVKDKAKSLEHIIQKCDPPTPTMSLVTTGATVPRLYSHIAHLVDKEEGEIPPPFKGAKLKQTRGRGKPKGKPQGHRQNPLKDQEADKTYAYDSPNNYYHNDNYTAPQVKIMAADLSMVKVVTANLEASHKEAEAKALNTINTNFRTISFSGVHINRTVPKTALTTNPIFREIKQMTTEEGAMTRVLSKSEDTVVVGPITRVTMVLTNISIIHMINRFNSMAHPVAYTVVSIIPLSTATKENMT